MRAKKRSQSLIGRTTAPFEKNRLPYRFLPISQWGELATSSSQKRALFQELWDTQQLGPIQRREQCTLFFRRAKRVSGRYRPNQATPQRGQRGIGGQPDGPQPATAADNRG